MKMTMRNKIGAWIALAGFVICFLGAGADRLPILNMIGIMAAGCAVLFTGVLIMGGERE